MSDQKKTTTTKKKEKPTEDEFLVSENQSDTISLASAIGEAIAKNIIKNNQVSDPTSAASISLQIEKRARDLGDSQADFAKKITEDKDNYVWVTIPTVYKQFRPSLTVSINGCTIKIPADGKSRKVHKVYAAEINSKLRYMDKKIEEMHRNNNIREIRSFV